MIIDATDTKWIYRDSDAPPSGRYLPAVYEWPAGVIVRFRDGAEYYDEPDGVMEGSPCHQVLVEAGITLKSRGAS